MQRFWTGTACLESCICSNCVPFGHLLTDSLFFRWLSVDWNIINVRLKWKCFLGIHFLNRWLKNCIHFSLSLSYGLTLIWLFAVRPKRVQRVGNSMQALPGLRIICFSHSVPSLLHYTTEKYNINDWKIIFCIFSFALFFSLRVRTGIRKSESKPYFIGLSVVANFLFLDLTSYLFRKKSVYIWKKILNKLFYCL